MAKAPRNHTALHMIVAMAVLVVPILIITAFFTRPADPAVNVVDPAPVARQASQEAGFPILVPQGLPEGWTTTRARWTPAGKPGLNGTPVPGDTWQLGMLTPDQTYIGLDQRDVAPDQFIAQVTRDGRPDGESVVKGEVWQRYVSEDGRTRSLVRRGASAVVVSGDLPYEALEAFAATLAPLG